MINFCILNTHIWHYYSNIRTLTPCGAWTRVVERLLAFDSLSGATVMVTEHLLAYYRHIQMPTWLLKSFQISTRLLLSLQSSKGCCQMCTSYWQSLQSSNGGCQTCTSFQQSLQSWNRGYQTCTSLQQSLRNSNGGRQTSTQGCRKQSADGQAQLDVGGEAVNNLRAKRAAKFCIFSCQEGTSASNWVLPLLCCLSLAVLNVSLMRAHVRTYLPNFTTVQRPHKSRTHNLCLNFGWKWSGHGRTSRTGSGAYGTSLWQSLQSSKGGLPNVY